MISAGQIEAYARNGFLVLDSGLNDTQIETIRSEIMASLAETEARRAGDPVYQEISRFRRFMVGLHLRNAAIRSYVQSPIFRAIGKAFIGNRVDLSGTSTITKSKGKNKSLDWHQDLVYDKRKDLTQIVCWTSITRSGPENGGLSVFPGSHRNGLLPHAKSELYPRDLRTLGVDPKDATPLRLRKGEVVVLHPLVVHGSSDNGTDGDRVALMSIYREPRNDMTEGERLAGMDILRD